MLLSAFMVMQAGEAEPADAGMDAWGGLVFPKREGALFDDGVQRITSGLWGNQADFAYIGGWAVNRGFFQGQYRITGWTPDHKERIILAENDTGSFAIADGALVYYGMDEKDVFGWLIGAPGGPAPRRLPIDVTDTVFYADDEYIWYYTYSKTDKPAIGRVGYDGKGKKNLGTVNGRVAAMMPGGEVLLADFAKNRVRLWKNGKYETIYSPKEQMESVTSLGKSVWVELGGWYGPLADGEITFRLPGKIAGVAGSTDQFVLLVLPKEDAAFCDVMMFNEVYRTYAPVGRIKRQEDMRIEMQENQMIIWGPEESLIFEYPIPELWLPYGCHDYFSAENMLDDSSWMQMLVGSWCAEPDAGSGYAQRLVFTRDELYRLPTRERKAKAKPIKSLWYVSGGRLLDYVDRDAPRQLWLSGPFTVPKEEGPCSPKVMIDGVAYYQYSNDPAYFDDLKDYGILIESSAGSPKTDAATPGASPRP